MTKSLLVHSKNTPLNVQKLFSDNNVIDFDYNGSQYSKLDKYISEKIIEQLKIQKPDIIFIKDNLSPNYLELYGLRLAYHIRFSDTLKFIPIVILSDIDGFTLNRLEPMAKILFTQNVFIIPNNKESVDRFPTPHIKLNKNTYKTKFLDLIAIEPPENSTRHSMANKWAIDRWARFLKVEKNNFLMPFDFVVIGALLQKKTLKFLTKPKNPIKENRDSIASMLYFKYLLAKNPISKISSFSSCVYPIHSGKVLYIDDEWDKGWSDILKKYFSENPKINFHTFEHNFKDDNINAFTLVTPIKDKIASCKPDIIILDLRFTQKDDLDDERKDINSFTGIRIRQMIKEINPGIQVIMFTATSKSLILEELYKHDILGYIKKEHPEDKNINTKESFTKLAELAEKGFQKSYLKDIWEISQSILKLGILKKDEFKEMKFEIESIFEILDSDLENRYKYSMFAIFKSIELFNDYFIEEGFESEKSKTKNLKKYKYAYWKDSNNKKIMTLNFNKLVETRDGRYNISTEIKIRNILFRFNLKDEKIIQQINQIVCSRNYAIHPKEKKNCPSVVKAVKSKNIIEWFKMLQTIATAINSQQAKR